VLGRAGPGAGRLDDDRATVGAGADVGVEPLPAFFADAPRIRVRDTLTALLGSAADGVLDYSHAVALREPSDADDADALAVFGALWLERVQRLLLAYADEPAVVVLRRVAPGA
jgi:hypothetical protein